MSRQVFVCLRPPPFPGFCLGWSSNFVGSESGQIQGVKPAEYGLQQDSTPPPSHTLSLYTVLCYREGGKGGEELNKREGNSSQSWVENTNRTDCIFNRKTQINTYRKVLLHVNF
jgi:hypothetical protein